MITINRIKIINTFKRLFVCTSLKKQVKHKLYILFDSEGHEEKKALHYRDGLVIKEPLQSYSSRTVLLQCLL